VHRRRLRVPVPGDPGRRALIKAQDCGACGAHHERDVNAARNALISGSDGATKRYALYVRHQKSKRSLYEHQKAVTDYVAGRRLRQRPDIDISSATAGQHVVHPDGYAPNATTTLTASTIYLDSAHLANTTGSAVTCAFLDKTTNCNGSACQFWPTISIAANTVYEVSFGGIVVSGVTWSCSTSNAVVAQLKGALTF